MGHMPLCSDSEPYRIPGIIPRLIVCKASALPLWLFYPHVLGCESVGKQQLSYLQHKQREIQSRDKGPSLPAQESREETINVPG